MAPRFLMEERVPSLNYNASAIANDGSCIYNQIVFSEKSGLFETYDACTLKLVLTGKINSKKIDVSLLEAGAYLLKTPSSISRFLKVNLP